MEIVGSRRSWPTPADGKPAVPFQHGIRDAVIRDRWSRRNDEEGRNATAE
jgi:hypothetical protein